MDKSIENKPRRHEKSNGLPARQKQLDDMHTKMQTPAGMRGVVAGTIYSKGTAKHRDSNSVVNFDVSSPDVTVAEVEVNTPWSCFSVSKMVRGFKFEMLDPNDLGPIDLGTFYSGSGLGIANYGDRYTPSGRSRGYTTDLVSAYHALGIEARKGN